VAGLSASSKDFYDLLKNTLSSARDNAPGCLRLLLQGTQDTDVNARGLALVAGAATIMVAGVAGADGTAAPASDRSIPAAWPSTLHGRITYSTRAGDIWVINANGTGRRRVTRSGHGLDFDPDFAPDGKRIVFRTSRGRYARDRYSIGLEGIFVLDVRTRRERQIQPWTGGLFPAWSPDGRTIAFSGLRSDGAPVDTIQLMSPTGAGRVDLGAPGECATWSPDGSLLAYCSHGGDGNWAVWVMRPDGSGRHQLTHPRLVPPAGANGDAPADWSPDSKRILYSSVVKGDREIFVMNADGSDHRRLTRWRGGDSPGSWLPDGRIVFGHFRGSEPLPHWYLMRPDGSHVRSRPWLYGAGDPLDWLTRR
jgi:Tol biopolymer transport system component